MAGESFQNRWGAIGNRWQASPSPAPDALNRGEVRWGAELQTEVFVANGKSGVLVPESAVPVSVGPVANILQIPKFPERVWELTLGLFWPNPGEGRQGPANGMKLHATFKVNYGVGSMNQIVLFDSGPGIDPTNDPVTTTAPYETTGLLLRTFDISSYFLANAVPLTSALEQGSAYINSAQFTIDGYIWAENLPGAAFATPDHTLHATIFSAVSPYVRGGKT